MKVTDELRARFERIGVLLHDCPYCDEAFILKRSQISHTTWHQKPVRLQVARKFLKRPSFSMGEVR